MALGVVCHWLESKMKRNGKVETYNAMCEKTLQLGRFRSGEYCREKIFLTIKNNCENLLKMAPKISSFAKCFRVSSSLVPLADKIDRDLWDNEEIRNILKEAGSIFSKNGTRLTVHPGQFCVLSSDHENVIKNSVFDLQYHAWILDSLGAPITPFSAINIHGGKSASGKKLIESISDLPDNVRKRLTLENDESCYSVKELLDVHSVTGIPIVFDSHHHTFRDGGMTTRDAMKRSIETWPEGIRPLQHVSNTEPELVSGSFTERRKHSNFIHQIPEPQLEKLIDGSIDLECEAKSKNYAVAELRKKLLETFPGNTNL